MGGFAQYGIVKKDYVILKGSVPDDDHFFVEFYLSSIQYYKIQVFAYSDISRRKNIVFSQNYIFFARAKTVTSAREKSDKL